MPRGGSSRRQRADERNDFESSGSGYRRDDSDWHEGNYGEPQWSRGERGREGQWRGNEWEREPGWGRDIERGNESWSGGRSGGEERWNQQDRGFQGSGGYGGEYGQQFGRRGSERQRGGYESGGYGDSQSSGRFQGGGGYQGGTPQGSRYTGGSQGGGYGTNYQGSMQGERWSQGSESRSGQHAGRGPKGYQRSDERIKEDVCDRLTADAEVDASQVSVKVKDAEVTLEGTVENREMKRIAEDCAEDVSGVRQVHNRLTVEPRAQSGSAGQSTGTEQKDRQPTTH